MKFDLKKIIPDSVILFIFLLASVIYFWTAVQGNKIYSADSMNPRYSSHACLEYYEQTGEHSCWTEALFSGMPNYHTGGRGPFWVDSIMRPFCFFRLGGKNTVFIFLFYLCAFFLLLRSFHIGKWISMAGAFATAMSSYFFVIIAASHITKCYSITWMTLVIIGFILIFRKEYGWGAIITMLFTYLGFFPHPQMSYYLCLMLGIFALTELYIKGKERAWRDYFLSVFIFVASFGTGLGMGAANVFINLEYAEQTMRGGHSDLAKSNDAKNKTAGLDLDYATAWSYGIDETMTLLIPNFMGGMSGYPVTKDSPLYRGLVSRGVPHRSAMDFCKSAPTYWGEKTFTSGPVYVGAIVVFLFVLGLLIVKNPYKWGILASVIFSILLSWGKNFMPLTRFFYAYFPFYNKFRAVESILVVAEIAIPILAFLAIQQLVKDKNNSVEQKRNTRNIFLSCGITAGICLLFALFGSSLCDFTSSYDTQFIKQVGKDIYQLILDQRASMLSSDAWRSFLFIVLGAGVLLIYVKKPFKERYLGIILTCLIVADMWPIDKRFCNDSAFVNPKVIDRNLKMLPYEKNLLESDHSVFRVFNLTANTFNDSRTSYYFNSIGGYSAAKLRRYQDLIDEHISQMNTNVLNMLNTKYIIMKGNDGSPQPRLNTGAFGNCWFVDSLCFVNNANAESDSLRTINLQHVAVLDTTFAINRSLKNFSMKNQYNVDDSIRLSYFGQNRLEYKSHNSANRIAVLSEIYYPYGWHATVDGNETDIFRVNYTLRAIEIPAGDHTIKLWFDPISIKKGNWMSLFFFFLMFVSTSVIIFLKVKSCRVALAHTQN